MNLWLLWMICKFLFQFVFLFSLQFLKFSVLHLHIFGVCLNNGHGMYDF